MRKILLSLLLATTAVTPALAAPRDHDRSSSREERKSERSESQKQKSEAREQRSEAREKRVEPRIERADARADAAGRADRRDVEAIRTVRERPTANLNERGRPTLSERQATTQSRQDQRQQAREQRQESRGEWQQQANAARDRARGARPDVQAPPPSNVDSHRPSPTWHTDWRNNHRYDWRRWRDRNRSIFHLGFYFDPFGWGYHRWNVGWRLWPSYYSSNYWLDDPSMYALPYAPWPYKWVRYYDDALLVNTYSGEVVDVIYDFFW